MYQETAITVSKQMCLGQFPASLFLRSESVDLPVRATEAPKLPTPDANQNYPSSFPDTNMLDVHSANVPEYL